MIRVVLVDDQTLIRQGVRGLLERTGDIQVVGEAGDGHEGQRVVEQHRPDVLLLDLRMPDMSGIELIRRLKARRALPPTLMLTTFDDDAAMQQALIDGARGFLLKDVSASDLAEAIRRVARGDMLAEPLAALAAPVAPDTAEMARLTRREAEVLRHLASGWSNKEIARTLGTTEGTVKNQVSSLLGKMGVRDRTRAVIKALQRGLL